MPRVDTNIPVSEPDVCSYEPDEMIKLSAASDWTGLTDRSLRRYIADGTLPAFRIGNRQIRVRRRDVAALFVRIPTVAAA